MKREASPHERYELVGELYHRDTGYLRPGKDEPAATGRDSSSAENVSRFDEWMATRCFTAALERIYELELEEHESGLPECLVPGCGAVAALCADHIRKGERKAWISGWHAGSGGESLNDNPFATQADHDEDLEDPKLVGYP